MKGASNSSAGQEDEDSEDSDNEGSGDDDDDDDDEDDNTPGPCSRIFSTSPHDRCSARPRTVGETRCLRLSFFRLAHSYFSLFLP
jgi:hypothetical protein